ncbi:YciI family protein [Chryseobacterium suipulveris]|uniref:YciI family protein n=1 Tax=Chryseobacterium suipulveris TaxID=2929800 RepID=A0ABY4BSQ5_9FLAO|nr:YciI family protein [Chryseobacterium suipulveris]UOE40723.1 YciI family protein [Chryseobacterium suipulveris]
MKNPFYYIIPLFLIVSCSTQKDAKDSSEKSKISFDQKLADSLGADQYGMKPYVIVILKTGKANITDKEKLNEHFRGHMENIRRLAKEGKLTLAGPFSTKNEREYRGIFIFNVKTKEDAENLVKTDPAVIAGVFDYEVYPWYGSAALPMFLKYHEKIAKENP